MLNRTHLTSTAVLIFMLQSTSAFAQSVVHNVKGYTSSANGLKQFSTLVFDANGKIVATGDDTLLANYPAALRIDGGGSTLLPGLIDAHAHVYGLGLQRTSLNLTGVTSLAAAVAAIEDYAAGRAHAGWVLGRGWNQVLWQGQAYPNATDIDAVVADRPVWLRRIDGHAGWANSVALTMAGIGDDTADPVGGKIVRDSNGHATGILIDKAMDMMDAAIPDVSDTDLRNAIVAAMSALVAEGITSVHDAGVDLQYANVYLSMADNDDMPMRVYAMIAGAGDALDSIAKPVRAFADDHLEIAAVKLYTDGALGSRGAAMLEPYSDDVENRGLAFWEQAELDRFVRKANGMGFQVGIHAIGDQGNRMALDAIERAQQGKISALRNRIEHSQVLALSDIPRFAELGVIASVQATHATSDKNMALDRLGPERLRGAYAWRRLLDAGAVLANGSDFPVELSNPFHGLYAAVTRMDRDGEPAGGWFADQALTRVEALHSFTYAAAYAAHQEDRIGSLEPGKWADFILIDRNYFTVAAAEIDDIQVLSTWVGGRPVFRREAPEQTHAR